MSLNQEGLQKRHEKLKQRQLELAAELFLVNAELKALKEEHEKVLNSRFWRMTKPLRLFCNGLKTIAGKFPPTRMLMDIGLCIREKGFSFTIKKIGRRLTGREVKKGLQGAFSFNLSKKMRQMQEKTTFDKQYSFAIFVWIDNTDNTYLKSFIQAMKNQTYSHWKLYLVTSSQNVISSSIQSNQISICVTEHKNSAAAINEVASKATEDYFILAEVKDQLHPAALFECQKALYECQTQALYTDEASFSDSNINPFDFHFKPDYAPITLRGHNYIGHMVACSKSLWENLAGLEPELDETGHYDFILRLIEKIDTKKELQHLPKALYYNREKENNLSVPNEDAVSKMEKALYQHLKRCNLSNAKVVSLAKPGTFRIEYPIEGEPLISILIPNQDHVADLSACIDSIMDKSTYHHFEIIIMENNSHNPETFAYYDELQKEYGDQIKVVTWEDGFNYSAINNFGSTFAKGSYLLLLNNDVQVITPDWLEQMLMLVERPEAGAVGVMLYYPDNTVQHAGVILGIQGIGGHGHKNFERGAEGYHNRLLIAQNMSCVTAACMMMPKKVFDEVEGFNEDLAVAFNDVDLCLKIIKAGYDIFFTPFAELYHFESKSRGVDEVPEKRKRFLSEVWMCTDTWHSVIDKGDPYYNPNLTLTATDFSYKQ